MSSIMQLSDTKTYLNSHLFIKQFFFNFSYCFYSMTSTVCLIVNFTCINILKIPNSGVGSDSICTKLFLSGTFYAISISAKNTIKSLVLKIPMYENYLY